MAPESTSPPGDETPSRRWLQVGFVIAVLAVIATVIVGPTEQWLRALLTAIEDLGATGALVFVAAYVAATVLFVPGLILTIAAGFLFGLLWGTVLVSVASTTGAVAAFFIGRYLARDAVRQKVVSRPRFRALYRALKQDGFKVVLLTRMVPLLPFNLLNYAYGLTEVSWKKYALASWLGMLPATIAYVYAGATAGNIARVVATDSPPETMTYVLWGLGLVATVGVVWLVTRRARAELDRIVETPSDQFPASTDTN